MEIRDFALTILRAEALEVKLASPRGELTDRRPGPALRLDAPARPPGLEIRPALKVPAPSGFADPLQRRRILHALANHELQAAELYAWALLAFPEAPPEMRRDMLAVLTDEQRHTRMYLARLEAAGGRFGERPVSGYFWNKVEHFTSPLRFLCAMALTFENANLDHTSEYAEAARRAGDRKTARVIERVHRDEIAHVRTGWRWLAELKAPEESMWDAFRARLVWPLRPAKARGRSFHAGGRRDAGLDDDFIRRLEAALD